MPNIGDAFGMIGRMFTSIGVPSLSDMGPAGMIIVAIGLFLLVFKELREEFFPGRMAFLNNRMVRWTGYVGLFCMILLFGVLDGGQFIYVSF